MRTLVVRIASTTLVLLIATFAVFSAISSYSIPPDRAFQSATNISDGHPVSFQRAIKKSRNSAVQVISMDASKNHLSIFSGTYVELGGNYFVVTVMHGIVGDCDSTKIIYNERIHDCKKYIQIDPAIDYGIIQVDKIGDREPVKIPRDVPKNRQWLKSYSVLNRLVYTGYPNTIGPLTIDGDVAGFAGTDYIYMLSYAWQGASGAGVFDKEGKYVGFVVAIDVGSTEFGVQVLENVVLVVPAFKIDWTKAITESE